MQDKKISNFRFDEVGAGLSHGCSLKPGLECYTFQRLESNTSGYSSIRISRL